MARPQPSPDGDENRDFARAVRDGIADVEQGRTVPYEEVRRWLLTWGTDREEPPPACG